MAEKEATLLIRFKEAGAAVLDKLVFTFGDIVNAAKAVGQVLMSTVDEFRKQEEAINSLNQTMINNGAYTTELRNKYLDYASALQQTTTFADEEAIAATSVLQTYLKQIPVTEELLRATADLATAKKMDLASAAELVGKTIGTETNALARSGIEVDKNASSQEKLAQVLGGLNSKWEGQAEAQAKGLGSLKQLGNAFGEIQESVGGSIAPLLGFVAQRLTEMATAINANAGPALGFMADLFIAATKFAYQISASVYNIGLNIASLASVAAEVLSGNLQNAKELFKSNGIEIEKIRQEQNAKLQQLDNMQSQHKLAQMQMQADQEAEFLRQSEENKRAMKLEDMTLANEQEQLLLEEQRIAAMEMAGLAQEQDKTKQLEAQKNLLDQKYKNETDFATKLQLLKDKARLTDQINLLNFEKKRAEEQKKIDEKNLSDRANFLSHMSSLQSSNNQALVVLGKAAAIAQIWISTAQAAASGMAWGTASGGPALGAVFSALAYAAGAANVARVAGVQLAEGGIVKARPGGIQATIGEGGQDEAVIPLGESGLQMGTTVNINVMGGMLGDERTAHQFALAIDKELLKLRRNNESVSFDDRVV